MSIHTSPYPTSDQGSVSLEPVFASEIVNVSEKLAQSRKRQASASLRPERSLGPDGAPGDPQLRTSVRSGRNQKNLAEIRTRRARQAVPLATPLQWGMDAVSQ